MKDLYTTYRTYETYKTNTLITHHSSLFLPPEEVNGDSGKNQKVADA
jgi:hypothetical protein